MSLIIEGVPEHFNYPITQWVASNSGHRFVEVPEGTGKMLEDLSSGKCDMAIALTEGSLRAMASNEELVCLGAYVSSPLEWGIHVGAQSSFEKCEELAKARVAISRFNSGSHLMVKVWADQMGWSADDFEYVVVNTLQGALEAFEKGEVDVFLWERFTTHPYVASGQLKRLDSVSTPWPCFAMMTTKTVLAEKEQELAEAVSGFRGTILQCVTNQEKLMNAIADQYRLDKSLVEQWYAKLMWMGMVKWEKVIASLQHFDLVPEDFNFQLQKM